MGKKAIGYSSLPNLNIIYILKFNNDTHKFESKQELNEHKSTVTSVMFSNDDRYIISSSFDNSIKVWKRNKTNIFEIFQIFLKHSFQIFFSKRILFWNIRVNRTVQSLAFECV